ncbi:MAG TPA: YrhA family protein [Hymenobacter sp.]|jgi:hypothetical protein
MTPLKTLPEYVRQVQARNAEYGDPPQPPASAEQLTALTAQARALFAYEVPAAYLELLALADGIDCNGYKLYASRTRPVPGYDATVEGFVEANGWWEDYEENSDHHLLMFGETGGELFLFDRRDQKFKFTDKVGGDAYRVFEAFEELAEQFFQNALGIIEDEQPKA